MIDWHVAVVIIRMVDGHLLAYIESLHCFQMAWKVKTISECNVHLVHDRPGLVAFGDREHGINLVGGRNSDLSLSSDPSVPGWGPGSP